MPNYLGDYLRQLRGENSLREFAAKCGISHTHLDSIEKGADPRTGKKVSISTDTLRLIADGIGVDFIFLACLADGGDPNAVAIDLKVSAPTVSDWESGKMNPSAENLKKLSSLYKVPTDYLLGLTDDEQYVEPIGRTLRTSLPIAVLSGQYHIPEHLIALIAKVSPVVVESWMWGKSVPNDSEYELLAEFFEIPVEDLKRGKLPVDPNVAVQLRVSELNSYERTIENAPSTEDEAVEVAAAYRGADSGIRHSVRKLLDLSDLKERVEELRVAARESDEPHLSTGEDTHVEI